MARYNQKIICINDIENPSPYQCRYSIEDAALEASVAKRGVLNPVIVTESKEVTGKFVLVSGHRRAQAALKAGLKEIPALSFEESVESKDLFFAAVIANWGQRFEDLDIAYIINQAKNIYQFSDKEILEEILPALGLQSEQGVIEEALQIFKLDSSVLEVLARGELPYRGVKRLGRFRLEDQQTFIKEVVSVAKLSSTQLIYVTDWLYDLLVSSKQSLAEFFSEGDYQEILKAKSPDKRQCADKFSALTKAKKYPTLTQKQRDLEVSIEKLTRSENDVSLEIPANMEDEGIILKARLRKQHSVEEVRGWLSEKKNALNSLFDIML